MEDSRDHSQIPSQRATSNSGGASRAGEFYCILDENASDSTWQFLGERQGMTLAAGAALQCSFESKKELLHRTQAWWDSLHADIASLEWRSDPYHVLVVTHGLYLKTLITGLVKTGNVERDENVVVGHHSVLNCSVTLVEIDATGVAKLTKYGDIEHLQKEQLTKDIVKINVDEVDIKP